MPPPSRWPSYLRTHLKSGDDVAALLDELQGFYARRGINLVKVAGKWAFRTAEDLSYLLERTPPSSGACPRRPWRRWPSSPTTSP